MNPLGDVIDALGVTSVWTYLALFLAASLLMISHPRRCSMCSSADRTTPTAYSVASLPDRPAMAMTAGTPVVNTSLDSGVPFVSLDQITGLTVPPGDIGALGAAINRLLDDADLRRRFGEAARARAESEFSVEIMKSRILSLYRQVLTARQAVP